MTTLLEILFWLSILVILYTYLGYGMLIAGANYLRRRFSDGVSISGGKPLHEAGSLPTVSLIIAAYNEEDLIEAKVKN